MTPLSGATGVGASANVRAVMSEALDPASVTTTTFELREPGGALVPAAVSVSGATATLDPSAALTASTTYTATVKGGSAGVRDQSGNHACRRLFVVLYDRGAGDVSVLTLERHRRPDDGRGR